MTESRRWDKKPETEKDKPFYDQFDKVKRMSDDDPDLLPALKRLGDLT